MSARRFTKTDRVRPAADADAGCSKNPSSKAAGREEARRAVWCVEPLSAAGVPVGDVFGIRLGASAARGA